MSYFVFGPKDHISGIDARHRVLRRRYGAAADAKIDIYAKGRRDGGKFLVSEFIAGPDRPTLPQGAQEWATGHLLAALISYDLCAVMLFGEGGHAFIRQVPGTYWNTLGGERAVQIGEIDFAENGNDLAPKGRRPFFFELKPFNAWLDSQRYDAEGPTAKKTRIASEAEIIEAVSAIYHEAGPKNGPSLQNLVPAVLVRLRAIERHATRAAIWAVGKKEDFNDYRPLKGKRRS